MFDALYKDAVRYSSKLAKDLSSTGATTDLSVYERPGVSVGFVQLDELDNSTEYLPCVNAINNWYEQKQSYNYENPEINRSNRDFTQLVWKSGKSVGVGRALTTDGKGAYVTAIYTPVADTQHTYTTAGATTTEETASARVVHQLHSDNHDAKHKDVDLIQNCPTTKSLALSYE